MPVTNKSELLTQLDIVLRQIKMPEEDKEKALRFAELYIEKMKEENGRLSSQELVDALFKSLARDFAAHILPLIAMLGHDSGLIAVNRDMNPEWQEPATAVNS